MRFVFFNPALDIVRFSNIKLIGLFAENYVEIMHFRVLVKTKKPKQMNVWAFVVPPGIEPGTHGFSVHCSTI